MALQTYLGTWPSADVPKAGDPTEQLFRCFTTAQSVLDSWPSIESTIMQNLELSVAGKSAALKKQVAELSTRLDRAQGIVNAAKTKLESDQATLAGTSNKPNDIVTEARAIELRGWFGRMDSAQQHAVVISALDESHDGQQGDVELLAALLNAPRSMRSLPPPIEQRIRDVLLQRKNPQAVQEQQAMSVAIQTAGYALQRCREYISQRASMTPEAPRLANA